MKFKDLLYEITLTELGETTESYDFRMAGKKVGEEATYKFKTPNYDYIVKASSLTYSDEYVEIGFGTESGGDIATNEGNQFKVISTVLDIAQDIWNRRDEIFYGPFDSSDPLVGIMFSGVYKRDEPYTKDEPARNKLYKTFIKKQFPSAEIRNEGSVTKVKIK